MGHIPNLPRPSKTIDVAILRLRLDPGAIGSRPDLLPNTDWSMVGAYALKSPVNVLVIRTVYDNREVREGEHT